VPLFVTGSHAFERAYRECLEALYVLPFWRPLADTAVVSG